MQETQVRSIGQEDPLEKGMVTHFSILAWRIQASIDHCSLVGYSLWGCKDSDTTKQLTLSLELKFYTPLSSSFQSLTTLQLALIGILEK